MRLICILFVYLATALQPGITQNNTEFENVLCRSEFDTNSWVDVVHKVTEFRDSSFKMLAPNQDDFFLRFNENDLEHIVLIDTNNVHLAKLLTQFGSHIQLLFMDSKNGILYGSYQQKRTRTRVLFSTQDGGLSWVPSYLFENTVRDFTSSDIFSINDSCLFLFDGIYSPSIDLQTGEIQIFYWISCDRGVSWEQKKLPIPKEFDQNYLLGTDVIYKSTGYLILCYQDYTKNGQDYQRFGGYLCKYGQTNWKLLRPSKVRRLIR